MVRTERGRYTTTRRDSRVRRPDALFGRICVNPSESARQLLVFHGASPRSDLNIIFEGCARRENKSVSLGKRLASMALAPRLVLLRYHYDANIV